MASIKFKVFVINLDSSQDRLASMGQQCAKLGLEFERISAVRGSDLTQEEKDKVYNLAANEKRYYKILNDGEIGCYLSHVRCYEQIIEQQLDCALVLEDDAILTADIVRYIDKMSKLPDGWDYIKLSQGRKVKKIIDSVDIGDGLSFNTALKLTSTTTGQFVSSSGAHKLLANAFPITRPIDIDIQYWFEKKLRCFIALPLPILNGDFDSEINQLSDRRVAKKYRLRRWLQKLNFEIALFRARGDVPKLPK